MRKILDLACCCLLIPTLCGCGSNPDQLVKEHVTILNEWADALEKDAPQSKLAEIQDRSNAINERFERLNLSTAGKRQLAEKAERGEEPTLTTAMGRLKQAMQKRSLKLSKEREPEAEAIAEFERIKEKMWFTPFVRYP